MQFQYVFKQVRILVILTGILSGSISGVLGQTMRSGAVEQPRKEEKKSNSVTNESNSTEMTVATGSSGLLEERDGVELRYTYTPQKSKTCTDDKGKYSLHFFEFKVTLYNGSDKTVTIDNAMAHSETDLRTLNHGLPCSDIPAKNKGVAFISTKLQPGESKIMYGSDWVRWGQMPTPRYRLDNIYFEKDKANSLPNNNLNQQKQQQTIFSQSYEQTSKELDNAKDISMQAYQSAISEGNTQSYSFAKGILEGASQINDPKTALVYTGVGLGLSLLFNSGERRREAHERELQEYDKRIQKAREGKMKLQQEAALKQVKEQFIADAKNINKYGVSDIVNNERYIAVLLVPYYCTAEKQDVYFSMPQHVPALSDGTYPLKTDVEAKATRQVKALNLERMQLITLYPIVNPGEFINEFTKKMGSGAVISFNAHLLKLPDAVIDKEPARQQNPSNKKDNFWDY